MATWEELEGAAPALAAFAADRLRAGPAYLASVDGEGVPRVHPVTPILGGGRLYVFTEPTSPKAADLRERGWYALHNGVPDDAGTGGEVAVRGRAREVLDGGERAVAAAASGYEPAERYLLFELGVTSVVSTRYGERGRPERERWSAPG